MDDQDYSALDKLLHRAVLGSSAVSKTLLALNQSLEPQGGYKTNQSDLGPVFVCGLARSGTTLLLRLLHASGEFRSLTYRDMPFVLAPALWSKISRLSRKTMPPQERAHGDGIFVDYDSPEAFEEVFWLTTCGSAYISPSHLRPHFPDEAILARFKSYVGSLLWNESANRYLSKNNNNILRIPALTKLHPECRCLVPFRHPVTHAASLLRQHKRFANAPKFTSDYMAWLGHFEFGRHHKPIHWPGYEPPSPRPEHLDYWMDIWTQTHKALLERRESQVRFICYESLCDDFDKIWPKVAEFVRISPSRSAAEAVRRVPPPQDIPNSAKNEDALSIYQQMRERAL